MSEEYNSQVLDHLGLVAGMYDELGIGELIDRLIPQDMTKRRVSVGQAVKALVLNGLGFVNQQLYLVPHFFQNKPTERLIGAGIEAAHLNDDVLGRALDELYEAGVSELYRQIGRQAAQRLGLVGGTVHLDTTSFHVDGRYTSDLPDEEQVGVVRLTQGYSRDHRPELNQVVLALIVEHQAGIPLLMKPLDGNCADKSGFRQIVKEHVAQLQVDHTVSTLVADSALYSAAGLAELQATQVRWITRVPETISEARMLIEQLDLTLMTPLESEYQVREFGSIYAGVAQRWLLISSAEARRRASTTVTKQLLRISEAEVKAFGQLTRCDFACQADAQAALERFETGLRFTALSEASIEQVVRYAQSGRPSKEATPIQTTFRLHGALCTPLDSFNRLVEQKSCFILATTHLDENLFGPQRLLDEYKGQARVERGFRFLKDPQFLASALFLKSPQRIMALLMVMTVCLVVYAALEWRIRSALQRHDQTFPNQKGQPSRRPTTRWVFHFFVGIHLLIRSTAPPLVLNLKPTHSALLTLLGPPYLSLYS